MGKSAMALKVIGAGLGRTGTLSLKLALEHIGFDPCYHAMEIVAAMRRDLPLWTQAIHGSPDWDAIFDGYAATTDYPGCLFWRELLAHYPDAKVILSIRDADSWFNSISETLFNPQRLQRVVDTPMGELNMFFVRDLGDRIGDRGFMTDYFEHWNRSVIETVPADRLLVFSARDGWEPLCDFLNVPVPEAAYPRVNSRDELNQLIGSSNAPDAAGLEAEIRAHLDNLYRSAFGTG